MQPEEVATPDQVVNADAWEIDLDEISENITEYDIVVDEEEVELATAEVLEDA